MRLVVRADGGPDVGYGHLVRTAAIAERFLDEGHDVTYATRNHSAVEQACPEAVEVAPLNEGDAHESFVRWLGSNESDLALIDSYEVGTREQRDVADLVPRLGVVVDDAIRPVRADVLINGNVYAADLDYDWVGPEPRWCLGLDYLPIRGEIRSLLDESPPLRSSAERALVTMGGSDIQGATPAVVRAFDGVDLDIDVIVGPGVRDRMPILRAVDETDADCTVSVDPPDLPRRMFEADIAVSATGSTIYELLALGAPTIGIPQADNQEPIADALCERRAIVRVDGDELDGLHRAITELLADASERGALQRRGRQLVDGQGVDRVYEVLVREGP